ncbi:MAG: NAD(P)H-binding protein [Flavihumibacter sp.]
MARKALMLGASGMIGSALLDVLLGDDYYDEVLILVRKPLGRQHPKLTEQVIDFSEPRAYTAALADVETVFCCIGTTMKQVKGDHAAYKKIDFDIPVFAAQAAAANGVFGYMLVSAIGADPALTSNFYLKLKGVTEEAVSKEQIPQVHIFRPSLLVGDRKEKRTGESIGKALAPLVSPLLFGSWQKYKPVKAEQLALAMLMAAKDPRKGIFIHEYKDIRQLALTSGRYQG